MAVTSALKVEAGSRVQDPPMAANNFRSTADANRNANAESASLRLVADLAEVHGKVCAFGNQTAFGPRRPADLRLECSALRVLHVTPPPGRLPMPEALSEVKAVLASTEQLAVYADDKVEVAGLVQVQRWSWSARSRMR